MTEANGESSVLQAIISSLTGASIAGLAKAAGWSLNSFGKTQRRRRVATLISGKSSAYIAGAVGGASADDTERLDAYLKSHEFHHVAGILARAYFVYQTGNSADEVRQLAHKRLEQDLTRLGVENRDSWVRVIGDAVTELVANEGEKLVDAAAFSPTLEAELRKTCVDIVQSGGPLISIELGLERRADLAHFIREYRQQVAASYGDMRLPHAGTTRRVPYKELFVEPALELSPMNRHVASADIEDFPKASVVNALSTTTRAVILGNPGGGKSTLSLKYVYDVASSVDNIGPDVPFLVILRDYAPELEKNGSQSIVHHLEGLCRFPLAIEPPVGAVDLILRQGRGTVVFDGLDELLDSSLRSRVVQAVEAFAHKYPLSTMLVTSRKVGYEDASLDVDLFPVAELADFSEEQVGLYARNWFCLDESIEDDQRRRLTDSFMADSRFVNDLRVNPLMLSLMCGIYASERYIPRNRPDVYEKCANLLFDSWDRQRGIQVDLPFDALVQSAMRVLALHMYQSPGDQSGISRSELMRFLTEYFLRKRYKFEDEAENAASAFLDFCKGRAWVLSEVGSETYSFTHRTFLEYFAASQLVRENTSAEKLYAVLKTDLGGGAVVNQLALQILGKTTEDGADSFLTLALDDAEADEGSSSSIRVLDFCVSTLSFHVPHPAVIDRLVNLVIAPLADHKKFAPQTVQRFHRMLFRFPLASAENAPTIQGAIEAALAPFIADERTQLSALAIAWNYPIVGVMAEDGNVIYPQVWRDWRERIRAEHSAEVRSHAPKSRWAAAQLLRAEQISLSELTHWHGVAGLYRSDDVGPLNDPAPAIFIVIGFDPDERHLVGPEEIEALAQRMLADPSILNLGDGEDGYLTGLRLGLSIAVPNPERLMLSLPILESLALVDDPAAAYRNKRRGRRGGLPAWAQELVSLRKSEILSATDPELLVRLELGTAVGQVLRGWISQELTFFSAGARPAFSSS